MKQCPQCNNSCDENDKVCSNCGYIFTPKEFSEDPMFNQQANNQPTNNQPYQQPMNNQAPNNQNFNSNPQYNNNPYNNSTPNYQQNNQYNGGWNNNPQPAPAPKSNGMSIASLVLGIIGLVTSCCYGLGFIPSIIAVVLGFISNAKINKEDPEGKGKGMVIAGIILGFVGIAIALTMVIFLISNREVFMEAFEKGMREYSNYNY